VDKFQGSERDVVIINTVVQVRPGPRGGTTTSLSRVGDPHFINVACSRSKHLLVLMGNLADISRVDENWKTVMAGVERLELSAGSEGSEGSPGGSSDRKAVQFRCDSLSSVSQALSALERGDFSGAVAPGVSGELDEAASGGSGRGAKRRKKGDTVEV
jgi:hypothetical protein